MTVLVCCVCNTFALQFSQLSVFSFKYSGFLNLLSHFFIVLNEFHKIHSVEIKKCQRRFGAIFQSSCYSFVSPPQEKIFIF